MLRGVKAAVTRMRKALYGSTAKEAVAEFREAFPGRCMICSYHEYGIREGHVKPGTPVGEHHCIEKENT